MLYVFCKVRGRKVIVRLLNNEPKYIEPLLLCLKRWSAPKAAAKSDMSWEERYIMLLWLSHLMLAPFQLSTISGFSSKDANAPSTFAELELPEVAQVLLDVASKYLCVPGKDREAASLLMVRLALRGDMQKLGLLALTVQWCCNELTTTEDSALIDQYRHVGLLTLLYGLVNASSSVEAAPYLDQVFDTCRSLTGDPGAVAVAARESAPARKLLIKTMRASMLHALMLNAVGHQGAEDMLASMLEDGIQLLLEWLSDTDTPVRQSASKALGMVILKLDSDMGADVIEAVLGCLNENILLEHLRTGQLLAATDYINIDVKQYKKNVNAVDPLKWHGAMLTLGHVLFRRCPPPEQLGSVLEALLMGLAFEQRSNVGISLGVGVRDAACFGIWSLARKYTTQEVEAAHLHANAFASRFVAKQSILQIVATELVLASCLDPSGNLRRGASAALQELIGRHPDVIDAGIPVVQEVDYHAVARRSRAMSEVAEAVSCLSKVYHASLLHALLDWRGCRAVDPDSRRQAAATAGKLFLQARPTVQRGFAEELLSHIADLKVNNNGVNAATRHGLLLSLSALLDACKVMMNTEPNSQTTQELAILLSQAFERLDEMTGILNGRVTSDLIHVMEATASIIAAQARLQSTNDALPVTLSSPSAGAVLDRCTTATDDETASRAAAQANHDLFWTKTSKSRILVLESWLPKDLPGKRSAHTCKGRIASFAKVFPLLLQDKETEPYAMRTATFLAEIIVSELAIETKVNAMEGISSVLEANSSGVASCLPILARAVSLGLKDYTIDQRGDIGSLLRLSSIDAVRSFDHSLLDDDQIKDLVKAITRLSAEKLSKVRFAAWDCLRSYWKEHIALPKSQATFEHLTDISSLEYYYQLTNLFRIDWLRSDLLLGLVSSIASGSDDVSQTASSALISYLDALSDVNRIEHLKQILDSLVTLLQGLITAEDREVLPPLDTMILILEQFPRETESHLTIHRTRVLGLITDLQTPTADIPRIQSLVRLLSHLSSISQYKTEACDRITRKLLHKWPRVRQAAVDTTLFVDEDAVPMGTDWNEKVEVNKPVVIEIRRKLGVAGKAKA